MRNKRIFSIDDPDFPYLTMILKLPEVARFISIDEKNYWKYVTSNENVFYFKAYEQGRLVGATHCEIGSYIIYGYYDHSRVSEERLWRDDLARYPKRKIAACLRSN